MESYEVSPILYNVPCVCTINLRMNNTADILLYEITMTDGKPFCILAQETDSDRISWAFSEGHSAPELAAEIIQKIGEAIEKYDL